MPWIRKPLLLAGTVFAVVLGPSFALGWFSLRAVQSERDAAGRRLLEDQERYAQFAGRAVRTELQVLEAAWEALVPRGVGWESRLDEVRVALAAARGRAFVRDCHLLHASGRRLYPVPDSTEAVIQPRAVPDATEAERIRELLAAAEAGEFAGDLDAALRAYQRILRQTLTPSLRATAQAGIGRLQLQRGAPDAAIREYQELLRVYPEARDLDNQPLRVHAQLGIARALESKGETLAAARALTALYGDLGRHSDEISSLQYTLLVERIEGQLARLLPRPAPAAWRGLERSLAAARARPKKQVGSAYLVHKLSRKLLRASLEGLPYSTPPRYVSETVEGKPLLLVYLFLPDASGTAVAGLAGLEIDLERMSRDALPGILDRLEPAPEITLAVVDESSRVVSGGPEAAGSPSLVTTSLGVPFDFWKLAVFRQPEAGADLVYGFRTKVYLYVVLMLLLTIVAGASFGVAALRHQSRLARLKTGFVSRVSHELRTPLTSIRLYTEMLELGGELAGSEASARSLGTIRRECERLQRLIDELLDFARLERGSRQLRLEYEEIGPLVRVTAEGFRSQAESEGFRYEVNIEPELPELRVDADAVRQMLLNLLSNAVKYSDAERVIVVRTFRRGVELGIQVEDQGIGVEPEEHQRIFEDFYRCESRLSSQRGGVGLGLTLVRRLAEGHGGRVSLESAPGQGSRFTVWLPVPPLPAAGLRPAGDGLAEAGGG